MVIHDGELKVRLVELFPNLSAHLYILVQYVNYKPLCSVNITLLVFVIAIKNDIKKILYII